MRRLLGALLALIFALAVWPDGSGVPGWSGAWISPTAAHAQTVEAAPLTDEDYADWERTAQRAEEALENQEASDSAFEELRADIADWRNRFQAGRSQNADRIKTLQSQIDSLGPAPDPETNESESAELATRRAQLQVALRELTTPVRKAEEAYAQADGLVTRIDSMLRARQKDKLLQRGPSPLAPGNLTGTPEDLEMVVRTLVGEVWNSMSQKTDRVGFQNNLIEILVLAALAALLLLRGQAWFRNLVEWTLRRGSGSRRAMAGAMVVSLGQVILPALGLILLTAALLTTSMFGPSGQGLVAAIPSIGLAFFATRWLGGQTFPRRDDWPVTLRLDPRQRRRGRFYTSSLGLLFAAALLVETVIRFFSLKPGTEVVLAFPIIVLASICLAGIARLLVAHGMSTESGEAERSAEGTARDDERGFIDHSIQFIGRACLVLAVLAPILAAIGYTRAAIFLSLSPSLTLAILSTVTFLQRLSMALFALVLRGRGDVSDGLLPVLVNFALMVAAIPFIARVWGTRKADLDELWMSLMNGVTIGDVQVSPAVVLVFGIAFGAGLLVTRVVQTAMRASVLPRTRLDPGAQKAAVSGLGYIGVFLSIMIAVSAAGLDLSNLAIVAGALSVGLGFGLQTIVSNFVSGLILLVERPVTEGDWIEVGGVMGTVRKISVRATTVETFDRTDVIVPNSEFVSGQVTNWTRGNLSGRLIVPVGVAYGTDTRRVAAILQEIAEAHPLVIVNPPPMIVFAGFGASSLDFEMRVILRDVNFILNAKTEINHRIAERFAEEGIEIPFAQQDIWLRNPEALRRAPADPPSPVGPPPSASIPDTPGGAHLTEDDT
ncbi:DUF3772 domain-containing protein [Tropicimonas sp. IMCC6043]|uniref:DUF3772 domain-containing protein n=1 Tax=Tropicimonas sp. IMCC6043 TaxID=2510645 RepID=UPI0013E9FF99|nr:DUF3772 domain-containing protein [Tropicimonas sp. IMCC6043]